MNTTITSHYIGNGETIEEPWWTDIYLRVFKQNYTPQAAYRRFMVDTQIFERLYERFKATSA